MNFRYFTYLSESGSSNEESTPVKTQAYEFGKKAFKKGINAAAKDKAFMAFLKKSISGETGSLLPFFDRIKAGLTPISPKHSRS